MRKLWFYIIFSSTALLLSLDTYAYALWWTYDSVCIWLQATLREKNCNNQAKWISKCYSDDFQNNICKSWSWPIDGPLYRIHEPSLFSDVNERIGVPTENLNKKILRYKVEHEAVTYAWDEWKDLDFILMIQEESLWEEFIFWDSGTSIGYCQFSKIHGKELYEEYLKASNWKERITLCHNHYLKFSNNVGVVFHGWKTRMRNLPSFTFK